MPLPFSLRACLLPGVPFRALLSGRQRAHALSHTGFAGRRPTPWAAALLLAALVSCVDKSPVSSLTGDPTDARLGVAISLGTLAADGDISAIRVVASYVLPNDGLSPLQDITVPYAQGESRDITLSMDISQCLRDVGGTASDPSCPVQVTVDVLAATRVLARDVLPIVRLRPGQSTSTAALAARGATSVRLRANNAVVPAELPLIVGGTLALLAEPLDVAGLIIPGRAITWASSAPTVASVSATGVVTGLAPGAATVSATTGSGNGLVRTSTVVNVSAATPATVVVTPATASIGVGSTQAFTAVARDGSGVAITPAPAITWLSNTVGIATVSATGTVTGVAPGTAVITARTANGVIGTATITVAAVATTVVLAPATAVLSLGSTRTLVPTVRDGSGVAITPTPTITWATSSSTVATVSASGVVTALGAGVATITARAANGASGTATITVVTDPAVVELTPASVVLAPLATQQIAAVVRDAGAGQITPTPALTWASGSPSVATVSATGLITAVASGTTTITARTANGVVGTVAVTVGVSGTLSGRVYEFGTSFGIANATVTFTNLATGTVVRTVSTDATGNYTSGTLVGGPFDARVSAGGFIAADVRSIANGGARAVEQTPLVRNASFNGQIGGVVNSATTNQPVLTTATVDLFPGQNNTSGSPIASVSTQSNGAYFFSNVPPGTYTVRARATGYSAATRTTASPGNQNTAAGQNIIVSPTGNNGSLRVVLTWGGTPFDLDAHLVGPAPNQTTFWVFWSQPGSCLSAPFACLDVDETDGFGPETITIAQRTAGVRYVYSVHNYSAEVNSPSNTGLAGSNARVDVYGGSGLLQSFIVPALPGTLWTVFDWDGTTVRPINTISGSPPPAGATPALQGVVAEPGAKPVKLKRR